MTTVDEPVPLPQPRRVVVAPPRPVKPTRSRRKAVEQRERLRRGPVADRPVPRPIPSVQERPAAEQHDALSPTTDIRHVMKVFWLGLVLAMIFGAKGLVHSGKGMNLGLERSIVLSLGEPLQAITGALQLSFPWDVSQQALGKNVDLNSAPLLSSGTTESRTTDRGRSSHKHPVHPVAVPPLPHLAYSTRAHPLRLLVTGDSLTEYLGPQLVDEATQLGPVNGHSDTHYGTGMVRPDFVDWSVVARQQVATYHPQAVVVFMGGNDDQNIAMPNGDIIQAGTSRWTAEYARRVAVCMRIWSQGGHARVYWLSMPPARSDSWSAVNHQINVAIQSAASQVPRARYLNILGPVTDHGRYADFVTVGGQPTLVRTPDGIHFNSTGSDIVSHEVLRTLTQDWHLGAKPAPKKRTAAHPSTPSST